MPIYLKDRCKNQKAMKEFLDRFQKSMDVYSNSDIDVRIFKTVFENVIDEEFFKISTDVKGKIQTHLEVH